MPICLGPWCNKMFFSIGNDSCNSPDDRLQLRLMLHLRLRVTAQINTSCNLSWRIVDVAGTYCKGFIKI